MNLQTILLKANQVKHACKHIPIQISNQEDFITICIGYDQEKVFMESFETIEDFSFFLHGKIASYRRKRSIAASIEQDAKYSTWITIVEAQDPFIYKVSCVGKEWILQIVSLSETNEHGVSTDGKIILIDSFEAYKKWLYGVISYYMRKRQRILK